MSDQRFSRNKGKYFTLDFDNFTERGLKNNLLRELEKNQITITEVVASNRRTKKDGQFTKQAKVMVKGGQSFTVVVGQDGDVIQTKLNAKIIPMRQSSSVSTYADELANNIKRNQEAFDKAAERKAKKVIDRSTVKPARVTIAAQIEMAKQAKSAANDNLTSLKNTESELRSQIKTSESEVSSYRSDLQREQERESELITEIKKLGGTPS